MIGRVVEFDVEAVEQGHRFGERKTRLLERVVCRIDGVVDRAGQIGTGQVGVPEAAALQIGFG